jgi:hypothetical protein
MSNVETIKMRWVTPYPRFFHAIDRHAFVLAYGLA